MTKWDDLVEAAARGNWHRSEWDVEPWEEVPEEIKRHVRAGMDAALRALLAKGCVIVPGEVTPAIEQAHFDAHAVAATFFAEMPDLWRAMLSAGSIKPEGE